MIAKFLVLLSLIASPQLAFSQIFKCKTLAGKIIYSEEKCSSSTSGSEIILDPNIIDSSALRNRISRDKLNANSSNSYQTTTTETTTKSSNQHMSEHDRNTRLRALTIDMSDTKAFFEKKADARNESSILQSPNIFPLSYDDEVKRRNLKIDLDSTDSTKRSLAYGLLGDLYNAYLLP